MPNMSEPNPELAAQFEKEDAERKAARANRDGQMTTVGKAANFYINKYWYFAYRYRTGVSRGEKFFSPLKQYLSLFEVPGSINLSGKTCFSYRWYLLKC
jgi:hypothetical protein